MSRGKRQYLSSEESTAFINALREVMGKKPIPSKSKTAGRRPKCVLSHIMFMGDAFPHAERDGRLRINGQVMPTKRYDQTWQESYPKEGV